MGGLAGGFWAPKKRKDNGKDKEKEAAGTEVLTDRIATEKYSGYFLDSDAETEFVQVNQGQRRLWLLLTAFFFLFLDALFFGLTYSQEDFVNTVRKSITMSSAAFLMGIGFWYPFAPFLFEKLVAGGIVVWVFSMTILREGIIVPVAETEDLLQREILTLALDIVFVVTLLMVIPLRRPTLLAVVGLVFGIQIAAGVCLVTVNGLEGGIEPTPIFGALAAYMVLFAVSLILAREEHATRVMFFNVQNQKLRIDQLLDEVYGLIRVKGTSNNQATSSAERLVGLLTGAIEELRWQENVMRAQMIKRAHRDSQQLPLDVDDPQRETSPFSSPMPINHLYAGGDNSDTEGDALQGLPLMTSEEEGVMVHFLSSNFTRQRVYAHPTGGAVSRRRSSVFFPGDEVAPPPPVRSVSCQQRVEEEVDRLLSPFEPLIPSSLGKRPPDSHTHAPKPQLQLCVYEELNGKKEREQADLTKASALEWNTDIKELEERDNEINSAFSPRRVPLPSGSGLKIKNTLPIIGLQLLRPYLSDPLNLKDLSPVLNFVHLVGFRLYGAASGTVQYQSEHFDKKLKEARELSEAVKEYGDLQGAHLLMYFCVLLKLIYLTRIMEDVITSDEWSCADKELGDNGASAWLSVIPSSGWLRFPPAVYRVAIRIHLGLGIPEMRRAGVCVCGSPLNPRGHHAQKYPNGGGVHWCHEQVKGAFIQILRGLHHTHVLEETTLGYLGVATDSHLADQKNKRADIFASLSNGDTILADVFVTFPISSNTARLRTRSKTAGAAAKTKSEEKQRKYAVTARLVGLRFVPLVFETFGRPDGETVSFVKELVRITGSRAGFSTEGEMRAVQARLTDRYWKVLGCTLQRYVAINVLTSAFHSRGQRGPFQPASLLGREFLIQLAHERDRFV
uniref:PDEase domain-containing protein n=1 Tax=Chromera velia CCMP2878 TaxID=1169474 RepID=A0A0G4G6D0_9ALVE|eukprot:Cvel_4237.t1-p1 / transcript=Cvel_4237.t1 / gene=Cvel_4237 / organism=Chromera_velia_CCMP2878 / gene_product=hypothetical protein / transcript_product=hypothetical protein / location=Cvel_scaffold183:56977-67321(+) / protein_length=900 / sequence_SO=supercontig / SO=protein_coding / is_pseudo=false